MTPYSIVVAPNSRTLDLSAPSAASLLECRPLLTWRKAGTPDWTVDFATPGNHNIDANGLGDYRWTVDAVSASWRISADANGLCIHDGILRNSGTQSIELARLHYLDGRFNSNDPGLIAPDPFGGNKSFIRTTAALAAPRIAAESSCARLGVVWPMLHEPIHDEPGWALSIDTGILSESWDRPGWFFGFTGPGTAFGQIGFRNTRDERRFFIGMLLDNVLLGPGETRSLESAIIRFGDWQGSVRYWANICADHFGTARHTAPLTGYCTWYQHFSTVTPQHVECATEELRDLPIPPGGRTIQIDDGHQRMPGDWEPNERFKDVWDMLPARIAETGSMPGLWIAPTTILETHPFMKEHPDWIQRQPNGSLSVNFSNWGWCGDPAWRWGAPGLRTYYVDPDHPDVKTWMRGFLVHAKKQGWRYFKIDFTYALSTARAAHDRTKTSFESLRDLYCLFREALGEDAIINACIGMPGRYALGHVDIARLGGDMGSDWSCVVSTLGALLVRFHTNGIWWQGDPDVFYMRGENSGLNEHESFLLMGTIGLLGGVFITSDYPSQWSVKSAALIRRFWTDSGPRTPADYRVAYSADGTPEAIRFDYDDGKSPSVIIAVYNWENGARSIRVSRERLALLDGLHVLPSTPSTIAVDSSGVRSDDQPAHSLRIVELSYR
jgi:hypothetical protein